MGVDWIRIKFSEKINSPKIIRLINIQHENFPLDGVDEIINDYIKKKSPSNNRDIEKYREASDALKKETNLPEEMNYWEFSTSIIHRVGVIVGNSIFPIEWRIEALRSLTNATLAELLRKWKLYISEVEKGKHRNYLTSILIHKNQKKLYESSEWLKMEIKSSYERTNAWTKKDKFLKVRKEFEESGIISFELLSAPEFDLTESNDDNSENESKLQGQLKDKEILIEQIKKWNRVVSSKSKVQIPPTENIEEFILTRINDNWLLNFFEWCELAIKENNGLYLWY